MKQCHRARQDLYGTKLDADIQGVVIKPLLHTSEQARLVDLLGRHKAFWASGRIVLAGR